MKTASSTAETMTMHRAFEATLPQADQVIRDPYAIHFVSPKTRRALNSRFWKWIIRIIMNRSYPGVNGAVISRVRFMDDLLLREIDRGLTQAVILGAGYDTRAYRLAPAKRIRIFEVDHPATQALKKAGLERIFTTLPRHVRFVSLDLAAGDLADALTANGFDASRKTLFILEGLVMYLQEATVVQILSAIRNHTPAGSGIVFDYLPPAILDGTLREKEGRNMYRHVVKTGEPFRFAMDFDNMEAYLADHGFEICENIRARDCRDRYFNGRERPISAIFSFVHARSRELPGDSRAVQKSPLLP